MSTYFPNHREILVGDNNVALFRWIHVRVSRWRIQHPTKESCTWILLTGNNSKYFAMGFFLYFLMQFGCAVYTPHMFSPRMLLTIHCRLLDGKYIYFALSFFHSIITLIINYVINYVFWIGGFCNLCLKLPRILLKRAVEDICVYCKLYTFRCKSYLMKVWCKYKNKGTSL